MLHLKGVISPGGGHGIGSLPVGHVDPMADRSVLGERAARTHPLLADGDDNMSIRGDTARPNLASVADLECPFLRSDVLNRPSALVSRKWSGMTGVDHNRAFRRWTSNIARTESNNCLRVVVSNRSPSRRNMPY